LCRIIRHLGSGISQKRKKHALPVFEIARVLVRFDHIASRIVNANYSPHAYQARTYMKIRQHPTRQNAHPLRWIVASRSSQVSSEADFLGDPWSGHQSLFGGRLLLKGENPLGSKKDLVRVP
jgi:hypothetical protein